jgi:tetratricopeptide (TPR) repeat protein
MVKGTESVKQRSSSPSAGEKKLRIQLGMTVVVEGKSTKPPASRFFRTRLNTANLDSLAPSLPEAGQAQQALSTDADFCQQLLALGYVQSFVDFYHLTHRADPNAGESKASIKMNCSFDDMIFIRDNLVAAEVARRQGNTSGVYTAYDKLADFYMKTMDWKTSIFFHEKCLEVSQLTTDARAEMSANHSLGVVYQKMNDHDVARTFHERHEEIAKLYDVLEEVAKANIELYKVYNVLAIKFEQEGKTDEALDMYRRCLESAKKCWDKAAEGEANGKIGGLLLNRGDSLESIPYLREQSQISADMGYAEGRCKACSALALAFDSLGQADKALEELTMVHAISEQAGDALLQSQASRALGTLYSKVGKLEEAVDALQRHFSLLRGLLPKVDGPSVVADKNSSATKLQRRIAASRQGDRVVTLQDLDLARTYVGISRGNLMMGAYVIALQSNLTALLDWKLARTDVPNSKKVHSKEDNDQDRGDDGRDDDNSSKPLQDRQETYDDGDP